MPSYQAPVFSAFGRNEYLRSTRGHIFEHYTAAASVVASDANGNKVLQTGTVMARITSGLDIGKVGPFQPGATDGRQTAVNIVGVNDSFYPYQMARGDREVSVLKHGRIVAANCYEYDTIGAPTSLAGTPSGTGGTIPAGTYRYVVTAVNGVGETVASNEYTTTALTGATSSVALTWVAPTQTNGLTSYNIYRTAAGGATGSEVLLTSVSGATAYTDTGAATPGTAVPPTTNTTMLAPGTRGLSSTTISALVAGNGQNDLSLLVY